MSVESKTNLLYVNIYTFIFILLLIYIYILDLFFGFGRDCNKVFPEPAALHLFSVPALTKKRSLLVNNSKKKKVSAFLLRFIGFETINFHIFFIFFIFHEFFLILLKINNY